MDDEYFRLTLSIRHSAIRPIAKKVADTALRGLARDEHTRFRRNFFQGVREVDIKTSDGRHIGRGGAYNVDLIRLGKVATRIMKGLYFHHYGKPLPAWCEDGLGDVDTNSIQVIQSFVAHLQQNPPIEIGGGVFKYWHGLANNEGDNDAYSSIWLLVFYESTVFFGVTTGRPTSNTPG